MKRGRKRGGGSVPLLALAALILVAGVLVTRVGTGTESASDYEVKLQAARRMEACLEAVRRYKAEADVPISPEDIHNSGLIGEAWTGLTTTLGALEAKRTAAGTDMAALLVELFSRAGLKAGDRVAAGFSGSFPGMNLAVICAGDAMGLEVVYISSVGASTYGANQPQLTFPDMAWRLYREGLVSSPGVANTLGGHMDCGLDMDQSVLGPVILRLEGYPIPLLVVEDYAENLRRRMELYEEEGAVACFVGVGGNMTTLGRGEEPFPWGLVFPEKGTRPDEKSGLLALYSAEGLPVLNLLNLRQLVTEYGLPYDPEQVARPGESAVYWVRRSPPLPALVAAGLALGVLIYGRATRGRGKNPWEEES